MGHILPTENVRRRIPIRAAVLDLLALPAPMPAAPGASGLEEREFLETLRRIVVRPAADELWDKYHASIEDGAGRALSRYSG